MFQSTRSPETKNSVHYLETRVNVFSFQKTPLHHSLALPSRSMLGEFRSRIHLFITCTQQEVNTIFLLKKMVFAFVFCMWRHAGVVRLGTVSQLEHLHW